MFNHKQYGRARTAIYDAATGRLVSETGWRDNLIFNNGLNSLANGNGLASIFSYCQIGSSNTANSVPSASVTFTQSGNTITASASFFTPDMTGWTLKYGTGAGGVEQTITYVSATVATSSLSYTQAGGIVGTAWNVAQATLGAFVNASNNYITSGGSNFTSYSANSITLQRTFLFPQQGSVYTVNEIGYSNTGSSGTCFGRIVLGSSDVVAATQFYVVTIQMTYTFSPGSPTAVGNVGSGGINTAGTAAIDFWATQKVASDGTQSSAGQLDGGNTNWCMFAAAFAQNSQPSSSTVPTIAYAYLLGGYGSISNSAQPVGVGVGTFSFSLSTTGNVVLALAMGQQNPPTLYEVWSLNFTTGFVTPNGVFAGTLSFTITFNHSLSN